MEKINLKSVKKTLMAIQIFFNIYINITKYSILK